jgi:hypothetical protein
MLYLPYERLAIEWTPNDKGFHLTLPWLNMDIGVAEAERPWLKEAVGNLHSTPLNENTQRFLKNLKDYPLYYFKPRALEEFEGQDLQSGRNLSVDCSNPQRCMDTVGIPFEQELKKDVPVQWVWDWQKILAKACIEGTDLYDPLSFISYLICYRLEWESKSWSGQDGLGQLLEQFLKDDEDKFFRAIGWISRQSWYVTMESCECLRIGKEYFPQAKDLIQHFIMDEAGHYKFMEQVFEDLNLNKEDFTVGAGTKWLLASHGRMAALSPLAFSAMINLFEAAYYEGEDPISRLVKKSSKPGAARGFDLHYKINQEHRHCDMPLIFAQRLAPQRKEHLELTLAIFELTLHFLDQMEKRLDEYIKI